MVAAAAAPIASGKPAAPTPLLSCMVAVAGALGAQYQESWASAIPGAYLYVFFVCRVCVCVCMSYIPAELHGGSGRGARCTVSGEHTTSFLVLTPCPAHNTVVSEMMEVLGEFSRGESSLSSNSSSSSATAAAAAGAGTLALPLLHALGSIVSGAEDAAEGTGAPEGVSTAAAGVCVFERSLSISFPHA